MTVLGTGLEGVARDLRAVRSWVRAVVRCHGQRVGTRRRNLVVGSLLTMAVLVLVGAVAAFADQGGGDPAMDAITLRDSHGLTPGQYGLPDMDHGGMTSLDTSVAWLLVSFGWLFYRFLVGLAVWFINQTWSFGWLDMLRPPAQAVGDALNQVTATLGLIPLLLLVSVLVTGVWMFRGRYAAGIGELAVSLIIGALATGVLANPVQLVSGPDGALVKAKQLGVATSAQVLNGPGVQAGSPSLRTGRASELELEQQTTSQLLDVFVRQPWQILTYGKIVDGEKPSACTKMLDERLAGKTDQVPEQNPRLGDAWATPAEKARDIRAYDRAQADKKACGALAAPGGKDTDPKDLLLSVLVMLPGGLVLVAFALALAVVLLLLCAITLWEAAKAILELLKGIIPGAGRSGLMGSFCTVLVCLGMIVGALLSLSVFTLVVKHVFASDSKINPVLVFFLVDLVVAAAVVAVVVLLLKARHHGRRLGEGLSKAMSPRPTSMPATGQVGGRVIHTAASMAGTAMMARRMRPTATGPGAAPRAAPPGGDQPRPGSTPAAAARTLGRVVGTGARAGMAGTGMVLKGTVGAPVYAPRAAAAAKKAATARRAALQGKLATSRQRATARADQAKAFGREYVDNTVRAGRFVGRVSGLSHLAVGGTHLAAGAFAAAAPHLAVGALASRALFARKKPNPLPPTSVQRPTGPAAAAGRLPKAGTAAQGRLHPGSPAQARTPGSSSIPRVSPSALPRSVSAPARPAPARPAPVMAASAGQRLQQRLDQERAAPRRSPPTRMR